MTDNIRTCTAQVRARGGGLPSEREGAGSQAWDYPLFAGDEFGLRAKNKRKTAPPLLTGTRNKDSGQKGRRPKDHSDSPVRAGGKSRR